MEGPTIKELDELSEMIEAMRIKLNYIIRCDDELEITHEAMEMSQQLDKMLNSYECLKRSINEKHRKNQ
ncbi:hypothetical protein Amet_1025 [Alkaliphilus metalliredigens QYMF]|uniref:Spo0E like sporulation regulatory protein n=1 Tax=Alkaliphilus metalliredigens (strain QYMF) TaxID=293826 RepID=A6TM24_ALKMQ|nr:Spo0E family sporulation regulatory protein-aspartic acid phosphatase [Alkaliphilus metalliredigens]ABR47242.1 hypothetical protein Amet_1025 [Alkaliphilus metalliredigens QYMF]